MNPFDSGSARRSNSRRLNSGHTPPRAPRLEGEAAPDTQRLIECDVAEPDVVAYFDGEADDHAALRARRHLDACAECARMWRDWGDVRLLLSTAHLPEVPAHWPASLVQRARLQALLPALFAAQPSAGPAEEPDVAPDAIRPPSELRRAILARTTRASEEPGESVAQASVPDETARLGLEAHSGAASKLVLLGEDGADLLCVWRYRRVTRACASVLAAWMLMLASFPTAEPTAQSGQPTPRRSQLKPDMEPHRLGTSSSLAQSLRLPTAPRLAQAEPGAKVAPEARLAPAQSDAGAPLKPGAASAISLSQGPSAAAPPVAASVERLASADTKSSQARQATGSMPLPSSSLPAVQADSRPAPEARKSRQLEAPAPEPSSARLATARLALASAPRRLGQSAVSLAAATEAVGAGRGEDAARASTSSSHARPTTDSAGDEGEVDAWEGAQHEPLALSRELNDTRPEEIGAAMDAYAATWIDEDEGAL